MNGITLIPIGELSDEAKLKLKNMLIKRENRMKEMISKFNEDGKSKAHSNTNG